MEQVRARAIKPSNARVTRLATSHHCLERVFINRGWETVHWNSVSKCPLCADTVAIAANLFGHVPATGRGLSAHDRHRLSAKMVSP
jgi:hypothetical protein